MTRPTAASLRPRSCARTWLPARLGGLAVRSWRHASSADPQWRATARFRGSGHQGPPLPDMDSAQAAGSNFLSNISLEPGGMGYVEILVRLQTEAAGDDFFLDLGGAAEDRLNTDVCSGTGQRPGRWAPPNMTGGRHHTTQPPHSRGPADPSASGPVSETTASPQALFPPPHAMRQPRCGRRRPARSQVVVAVRARRARPVTAMGRSGRHGDPCVTGLSSPPGEVPLAPAWPALLRVVMMRSTVRRARVARAP
jgi:hypothetical protein